jgi:hypothetical protein
MTHGTCGGAFGTLGNGDGAEGCLVLYGLFEVGVQSTAPLILLAIGNKGRVQKRKERLAPTGVCTFAAASLGRATAARRWLRSGGMNPLGPYFFFEPFMSSLLFSCVPNVVPPPKKKNYKSTTIFLDALHRKQCRAQKRKLVGWFCLALFVYVQFD